MVGYRPLGQSDIEVSEIGFGTWTLTSGWWGTFTDEEAVDLLRRAYDSGISYYDTGEAVGDGRGERLLAQAFKDRRELVIISTKVGHDPSRPGDPGSRTLTPDFLRESVEASLRRLESSYIDLLQVHHPSLEVMKDDAVWSSLEALRAEGKIRHIGAVMGPGPGWLEEARHAMRNRGVAGVQLYYNILEEEPGRQFFPVALELNQGMVVRGPHAGGVLESSWEEAVGHPADDDGQVKDREFVVQGRKKAEKLAWIHEDKGMNLAQAALKFILSEETVASVIPNIYRAEHLDEYGAVSDFPGFEQWELGEIAERFRRNFDVS